MNRIALIYILLLAVFTLSSVAIAQTTNMATQTVAFAVHRPIPAMQSVIITSEQANNQLVNPSESELLQAQLKQSAIKMTIFTPNKAITENDVKKIGVANKSGYGALVRTTSSNSFSGIHKEVGSLLEAKVPVTRDADRCIVTVTE